VPWEVKEGAAAVAAYREGDEGPLWDWVEELIDRKPDPFMRVKVGSDVTKLGDDLTVQHTFALLKAHKRRVDESTRARQGERVSKQLYERMDKSPRRDYMKALEGYETPPNETLKKVLPGAVFSLDENMPLYDLRPKVQKMIITELAGLASDLKLGVVRYPEGCGDGSARPEEVGRRLHRSFWRLRRDCGQQDSCLFVEVLGGGWMDLWLQAFLPV
jgi:hypothetical protein